MHRVVAARPAKEREPTCRCQTSRVIDFKTQCIADCKHRDRETTVEIDVAQLRDTDTCRRQCSIRSSRRRWGGAEICPFQKPVLTEIRAAMHIYPLLLGNAELAGAPPRT